MSQASLTARYRPQTFAQVAGQGTVKSILSRAALEQRVAPAYLFSGTRGVGKTTLARIFAKALNCRTAPTGEPCNVCDQCRAITLGNSVDVVEIDGASNRGIDDVRRLKEVVGYAPMEGGYKIFIIDEAHMLSREAFNALLKTLEEPPARVTFLLATTEPHKFPATIISRCQHYVCKPLSEKGLADHLSHILASENVEFEESAVRLVARRGAGSVRDSLSLLGQVLALGREKLTEESARNVLGLAGQEAFLQLLDAFAAGDILALSSLLRAMLDQGLDIGFFLRELASLWRNLFMLRQAGEAALAVVDLPENESRRYLELCRGFSLQQIHACWQMTLEGQRRVLTSLEPALALELLLLNLGMLPQLVSLENIAVTTRRASSPREGGGTSTGGSSSSGCGSGGGRFSGSVAGSEASSALSSSVPSSGTFRPEAGTMDDMPEAIVSSPFPAPGPEEVKEKSCRPTAASLSPEAESEGGVFSSGGADQEYDEDAVQKALQEFSLMDEEKRTPGKYPDSFSEEGVGALPSSSGADLESFFALCEATDQPSWLISLLRRTKIRREGNSVTLTAPDEFILDRIKEREIFSHMERLFLDWCGVVPDLELAEPGIRRQSREEIKGRVLEHPLVREIQSQFGGYIIDYGQIR
jgi:DNA polymerase-3 subunit gamma/tau